MDRELANLQLHGLLTKEDCYVRDDYLSGVDPTQQSSSDVNAHLPEMENADGRFDLENVDVDPDSNQPAATDQSSILARKKHRIKWREMICEWAYKVVDHFGLHREIVYVSLHYVDRYCMAVSSTNFDDKHHFQLLSMSSLLLAIKLFDSRSILLTGSESSTDTILQLSRGMFTVKALEQMEWDILQRLQWYVHPPTPRMFLCYIVAITALEKPSEILQIASFLIELSVLDYFFIQFKASEVALGAILNAVEILGLTSTGCDDSKQTFATLEATLPSHIFTNVSVCQERLKRLHANSNVDDLDMYDPSVPSTEPGRISSPLSVRDF